MNPLYSYLLLILSSLCFNFIQAQDTIYTLNNTLYDVRVRDNQPDFVEYRIRADDFEKNYFLNKKNISKIVLKGGFAEEIVHSSPDRFHSVFSYTDSSGNTLKEDLNYSPTARFANDNSINLCRFTDDKFYTRIYRECLHFYINDPERKFFFAKEITFKGVDFSCMKLTNYHDRLKAAFIKKKYLSTVAVNLNNDRHTEMYPDVFLKGKKLIIDAKESASSYKTLEDMSWVSDSEYNFSARKIPAIIQSRNYQQKQGLGIVFIIETFSKPEKQVSGYWVVFDFNSRDILLIDYINFGRVAYQTTNFGSGWDGYWETACQMAGALEPISFQNYLSMEKKGTVELTTSPH